MKRVKVCLLGFGGIARSHLKAYHKLTERNAPVDLVAICDIDPSQFTKGVSMNLGGSGAESLEAYHLYTDAEEMIRNEQPDVVDICLPSFLHCEYAIKMMKMGCNVLSEKPMALSSAQCAEMISVAKETGKYLMVGQCLRFEPAYNFLKDRLSDGSFGPIHYAHFDRLSALPLWGFEQWFRDSERSGGCILDMHIHDVDMVRYLFGEPKSVSAVTTGYECQWQVVNSRFEYENGTLIVADGSWDEARSSKFYAGYRVRFADAEVFYDDSTVTVRPNDGEEYVADLPKSTRMADEIECLALTVLGVSTDQRISATEAAKTVALVEKLRESAAHNGTPIRI
ncbi:MAG: Gfo/Idh/MocA family oxidoreductase [Clostridia bacterium]|nr:Gfo/Idh/MocA family oxidoreductase [Clostridia bacterium]